VDISESVRTCPSHSPMLALRTAVRRPSVSLAAPSVGRTVSEDAWLPRAPELACRSTPQDVWVDPAVQKAVETAGGNQPEQVARTASVENTVTRIKSDGINWQWLHSTGFIDYRAAANAKIEHAYQRGDSKVRIQDGKDLATPMEIFFVDMVQYDPKTGNPRTVRRVGPDGRWHRARRSITTIYRSWSTGRPWRETFEQYQLRRKAIDFDDANGRSESTQLYQNRGCCARMAKSNAFFVVTMLVVLANSLWIAFETDNNEAIVLSESDIGYQIVEHCFCLLFTVELLIRFFAFQRKRDFIYDVWFRFDLVLVLLMIMETWLLPFVFWALFHNAGSNSSSLGALSVFRLARLVRLTRMTRLLRAVPEVITLLKGIVAALRSVFFTLVLLVLLLYIFGIIFRSEAKGSSVEDLFPSVTESMWVLLVHGTFLDAVADVITAVRQKGDAFMTVVLLLFILLSSFTVLNMLIGILCGVITRIKEAEDRQSEDTYLRNNLLDILECYDRNLDKKLGREEFDLLMENPEVRDSLKKFGTDVKGLKTLRDVLFENATVRSGSEQLSFEEFIAVVMRLRGEHGARVTDVVELRAYMKQCLDEAVSELQAGQKELRERFDASPRTFPRQAILHVLLTMDGGTTEWRHSTTMTIGQLLRQHSQATATDANGTALGEELTLGDLQAECEGALELRLRPRASLAE